jgi:hypothetical protein
MFISGSGRSDSETSNIPADDESLKNLANLFQIKEEQMRKWLCNRKIVTVRESYDTPMNAKAVRLYKKIKLKEKHYKISF